MAPRRLGPRVYLSRAGGNEERPGAGLALCGAARAKALLEAQRAYTDTVERRTGQVVRWVFHRDGKRVKSIRQAWRTACAAAKLVGHSSEAIYHRYSITNDADVREALAKVAAMPAPRSLRIRHA